MDQGGHARYSFSWVGVPPPLGRRALLGAKSRIWRSWPAEAKPNQKARSRVIFPAIWHQNINIYSKNFNSVERIRIKLTVRPIFWIDILGRGSSSRTRKNVHVSTKISLPGQEFPSSRPSLPMSSGRARHSPWPIRQGFCPLRGNVFSEFSTFVQSWIGSRSSEICCFFRATSWRPI